MKMLIAAIGTSTLMASAALAAPVSNPAAHASLKGQGLTGSVIDIRDRRRHHNRRRHYRRGRHHYAPGSRRRSAPRGWRRHRYRPHNWRSRGCIVVGPVCFCP